jgi:hypothetical protein
MFTKKTQLFAPNVEANMITNLTPTEIEELRIAIAEECGWEKCHCGKPSCWWVPRKEDENSQSDIPPYTTSLDAIQAAAMERFKKEECVRTFAAMLRQPYRASVKDYIWQLSALDWCIAFARTAKIWRYKL